MVDRRANGLSRRSFTIGTVARRRRPGDRCGRRA